MKGTKNIWRQVLALLLVSLFVSIQVVKVLHTHTAATTTHLSMEGDHVEKMTDCDICDYQMTKDSALSTFAFESNSHFPIALITQSHTNQIISSVGLSFSDRGPPAFA